MAKKYNFELRISSPKRVFSLINLSRKEPNNIQEKYALCKDKINGALLDNGILYSCCIAQGIHKFFNSAFKKEAIPFAKKDTLNIYKVSSVNEITEFLNKPKTICAYCHYHDKTFEPNKVAWKVSEKKLSEWYVQ